MKISAHAFAAVAQCMSTEKARYYINGVLVEPEGTLVATDGHALLVAKPPFHSDLPTTSVIVQPDKPLITAAKKRNAHVIKFTEGVTGPAQVLTENGVVIGVGMAIKVDATYPDWRAVVKPAVDKTEPSKSPATFNTDVMTQFVNAAKIATQVKTPGVQFIGRREEPSPVYFNQCDWIAGVAMPMRDSKLVITTNLSRFI
jgi:hypothetical protein